MIINDSHLFNSKLNIAITVNIAMFLITAFLYNTAGELKSVLAMQIWTKTKKLFLYFDFCHTLLTSTEIERSLMRRNVVLSTYQAIYLDQTQVIT